MAAKKRETYKQRAERIARERREKQAREAYERVMMRSPGEFVRAVRATQERVRQLQAERRDGADDAQQWNSANDDQMLEAAREMRDLYRRAR